MQLSAHNPSRLWLWLLPTLLLTAWLGTRYINIPLWFDEWYSIYTSGGAHYGPLTVSEVWSRVAADDFQTPGHYLLLWLWNNLAGSSPFAGRWLSVLIGLLAVTWLYRLARDMVSPLAGVCAAAALGFSAFFANYLHELRAYGLYALLATFTVWVYWRLLMQRRPHPALYMLLLMGTAALFYTHYFASLIALMIGAYHLLFAPKNRRWLLIAAPLLLGGLLFLPWMGTVLQDLTMADAIAVGLKNVALDTPRAVQDLLGFFSNGGVLLLAFIGLYTLRQRTRPVGLGWFWLVSVLVAALLVNERLGVLFSVRHLLGLWPALALLTGTGLAVLARRGISPLWLLGLWAASGIYVTLNPAAYSAIRLPYAHLHWDSYADALRGRISSGDTAIFLLPDRASAIQHEKVSEHYLHGLPGRYYRLEAPSLIGEDGFTRSAASILKDSSRVWIGYDAEQPPAPHTLYLLDTVLINSHVICDTPADTAALHLRLYAPNPPDETAFRYRFGEGIAIALLLPPTITPAVNLSLALGYANSSAAAATAFSTALHIENADGQIVTQADYGLLPEAFSCRAASLPLAGLPAGDYRLWLIVYRWADGSRLTSSDTVTGVSGDRMLIHEFSLPAR